MSYSETVHEALVEAQELKSKVLHEQAEIQQATHRLVQHAMDLQDVIWRLHYELKVHGVVDEWGDPIEGDTPPSVAPARAQAAIQTLERKRG